MDTIIDKSKVIINTNGSSSPGVLRDQTVTASKARYGDLTSFLLLETS